MAPVEVEGHRPCTIAAKREECRVGNAAFQGSSRDMKVGSMEILTRKINRMLITRDHNVSQSKEVVQMEGDKPRLCSALAES